MTTDAKVNNLAPVTFDLTIDAGNSFTKACLVKGRGLVETCRLPSLLRYTSDSHFVYGGFVLDGVSAVVGKDCQGREDAVVIGEDEQGKMRYLAELISGVISAFTNLIPVGSHLRLHLLTLSFERKAEMEAAVAKLATLHIDGKPKHLTVEIAQVLGEGHGCSLFAASQFKQSRHISVLDIGGGTMNLSSYMVTRNKGNVETRRDSFKFAGVGISNLIDFVCTSIAEATTNGRVDRSLVVGALQTNTLRMLNTFDGTDISSHVDKAITQWMRQPVIHKMLAVVIETLNDGGFVSCCGGGFRIKAVRDAMETTVLANISEEATTHWLIPNDTDTLGVTGAAQAIAAENRRLQKQLSKDNTNATDKPKRSRSKKAQPSADSLEPVAATDAVSSPEQPTATGVGEPDSQAISN